MTRRYSGHRDADGETHVIVETKTEHGFGDPRPLPLRLDLRNHSPTGFEWGYAGSGPAQLALAIVCDALGVPPDAREPAATSDENAEPLTVRALRFYQGFKDAHVAHWTGPSWWILDEDVLRCIDRLKRETQP